MRLKELDALLSLFSSLLPLSSSRLTVVVLVALSPSSSLSSLPSRSSHPSRSSCSSLFFSSLPSFPHPSLAHTHTHITHTHIKHTHTYTPLSSVAVLLLGPGSLCASLRSPPPSATALLERSLLCDPWATDQCRGPRRPSALRALRAVPLSRTWLPAGEERRREEKEKERRRTRGQWEHSREMLC